MAQRSLSVKVALEEINKINNVPNNLTLDEIYKCLNVKIDSYKSLTELKTKFYEAFEKIQNKYELDKRIELLLFNYGYTKNLKYLKNLNLITPDDIEIIKSLTSYRLILYDDTATDILVNILKSFTYEQRENFFSKNGENLFLRQRICSDTEFIENILKFYSEFYIHDIFFNGQNLLMMILTFFRHSYIATRSIPKIKMNVIKKAVDNTKINKLTKREFYTIFNTCVENYNGYYINFPDVVAEFINIFIELGVVTFENNIITNYDIFEIKSYLYYFNGRNPVKYFSYNNEYTNDSTKNIFVYSDKYIAEQRKKKSASELTALKRDNEIVKKYLEKLMKKYNYVPNQEMFDYCFKCCDNEIFPTVSNLQIPSNVKFTSEHMTLVCEHGDANMLKFLLDQKLVPSADNIRTILFKSNKQDQAISELLKGYGVLLPNTLETINFNKKIDYSVKTLMKLDMLKIPESDINTAKKKYFTKGTAKNMELNGSVEALQLAFLFDSLDNIKNFMDKHKVEPDLTCLSNSILNENNDVMLWVEKTYNYKPSVLHILKAKNWNTRAYLLNKYYPELCDLAQYNTQTITLKNKPLGVVIQAITPDLESEDEAPVKKQKVIKTKISVIH
jgi:hypothetical protein